MIESHRSDDDKRDEGIMPSTGVLGERSEVLLDVHARGVDFDDSGDELWQEREERNAFKHVEGLGELQDVTEVEYRKVRLERVVACEYHRSQSRGIVARACCVGRDRRCRRV